MTPVINITQVHYPESDGRPMGETDEHRDAMVRHIELLRHYYRGQQVYVSGDLLVYYEQGNPKKYVVPDAFVVKGVHPRKRRIYKIWVERKPPDVVIETTSRKTRRKDTLQKPALYAQLGVKEYFIFDPDREYLDPPLQGHRLAAGAFVPIQPDGTGALVSEELGLRLRLEGDEIALYRLDTGERLLTAEERAEREAAARQAEAEARQAEAEARRAAEAEIVRLREELSRTRPRTET
jgi:Uma2 family endonuclease